jgi:hypothetical protein
MLTHPLALREREKKRAKVSFYNKGMGRMKQQPDAFQKGRKEVEYIYPAVKCVPTLPSLLEISAQQMRTAIYLNSQ